VRRCLRSASLGLPAIAGISYYPEARAQEIVANPTGRRKFRWMQFISTSIPAGYAPFTINRRYFPTFEKMISDFRRARCAQRADHHCTPQE